MKKTSTSIKEYIASLPTNKQNDIIQLDKVISTALPQANKVMWEGIFYGGSLQRVIGYGIMTYGKPGKELEWYRIGLSLQKNYISITTSTIDIKKYIDEHYKDGIGKVKLGKSTITFNAIEDIDLNKLSAIVKVGYDLLNQ
jgi:hypothetical protein